MDQPVMAPAEQQKVAQRGRPAIGPVHDLVRVAPGLRTVASGEAAIAIPYDHGSADRGRDDRRAPPDIQWL